MYLGESIDWGGSLSLSRQGRIFVAHFSVTGLPAYSTAASGPLLWNGTGPLPAGAPASGSGPRVLAAVLGLSIGWTTAPGATGMVGVGIGTSTAPTSASAVTAVANLNQGANSPATPQCTVLNAGTVSTAAVSFLGTHSITAAATTAEPSLPVWVPLEGLITLAPTGFACVAGAAAVATEVSKISLVWAEIPY